MELELASDEGGGREGGKKIGATDGLESTLEWGRRRRDGGWEGRKTEKNLQVIEKEMGKGGRMEMEGTFVSREKKTMETRKQGPLRFQFQPIRYPIIRLGYLMKH